MPDKEQKPVEPVKTAATVEQKLEFQRNQVKLAEARASQSQEIGSVSRQSGAMAIMPQTYPQMESFIMRMSQGGIAVGKALRGNPGACEAVAQMAWGWGMNPYAVSQKCYIVKSQKNPEPVLAFEAQLINAVINARAPLAKRTKISYRGEGGRLQCVLTVHPIGDEPFEFVGAELGKITIKNSPLWMSNPRQQLAYHTQRNMARLHYPEIIMGVYSREEMEDRAPTTNQSVNIDQQVKDLGKSDTALAISVVEVDDNVDAETETVEAEVIEDAEIIEDDAPETAVESQEPEVEPEDETQETVSEDAAAPKDAPIDDVEEIKPDTGIFNITVGMTEWKEYLDETDDPDAITEMFLNEADEEWRTKLKPKQIEWITNETNARIAALKKKDGKAG